MGTLIAVLIQFQASTGEKSMDSTSFLLTVGAIAIILALIIVFVLKMAVREA
jgi:hypothetical protein